MYAAPGEDSIPYLRPYDVFDYLPQPADFLSRSGSTDLERLVPQVGTILQTCSGRNLGPLAYADAYINRFVVSDDMLRLQIDDEIARFYTLAFLSTPTGQSLLTRSKTGNVIDHLSGDDLASVLVPFIDEALTSDIAAVMSEAVRMRESARVELDRLVQAFSGSLPEIATTNPLREGWTVRATDLKRRFDAAYNDPRLNKVRSDMARLGGGTVADVARTAMPNRYKRNYVEAAHGRPILSGRQLLQLKPVNLQYIATSVLDTAEYELGVGTLVFGARGRAEERVSLPALIVEDRADWLASHNVMRVHPREGISAGWLYLCFAIEHVQLQVRGSAFGSVVDVVDAPNLDRVVLPPVDNDLGDAALQCWRDMSSASTLEATAIDRLEDVIVNVGGSVGRTSLKR
ncbi:hypothetical protein BH683_023650 [Williamsia sp. 1138]|nr:hypothetical protein BH683_023650 [Williamsia sp. 1138]